MRGDLRQSSLAEVVRHLYAERQTGILHVSRQGIRRRIHFSNGVAIFADSGDHELQEPEQAELLAYSLFSWTSGEFEFEDGGPNIADSAAFEVSPSTLILDGIRRIDELEILEQLIGGRDTLFACVQTPVLPLFKMKLSPAENAILTFARDHEQFTAEELPLPSGDLPVVNALNALVAVGLLETVNKATAPILTPQPLPVPVVEAASPPPPPPAPPPIDTTPPPAPVATAPTPDSQITPIVPSVSIDMEQLLDTLESKRSGIVQPKPAAPTPMPQPAPPPPQPPLQPNDTQPTPTLATPPPTAPEPPTEVPTQPRHSREAVAATPVRRTPAAASSPRTSSMADVSSWIDALAEPIPAGKPRLIAAGSIVLIVIVALVGVLGSGNDESTRSAPVAADSAPSSEPSTPEPQPIIPTPPLEPAPGLEVEPEPEPAESKPPTPYELLADARAALNEGDLQTAQSKLDQLKAVDASYQGAEQLREELSDRLWEKTLPLAFTSRHDHALGGCDGVLTLTSLGFRFRSNEHEWFWSFPEIGAVERRDGRRLRIENAKGQSYNLELRDELMSTDWARYQSLMSR